MEIKQGREIYPYEVKCHIHANGKIEAARAKIAARLGSKGLSQDGEPSGDPWIRSHKAGH
jgi:hypothetical protein